MANDGTQKNPGGLPYRVINDNRFDQPDGSVQQCLSLEEAWSALTSIRPKGASQDSPMTAQPLHDTLAFILSQLASFKKRKSALYFPGLWPGSKSYLGTTGAAGAGTHVHYSYQDGHWRPTTGGYLANDQLAYSPSAQQQAGAVASPLGFVAQAAPDHAHSIDFGQYPNLLPIFCHAFSPAMPADGFIRGAYQNQKLSIKFHVCQTPVATILAGMDLTSGKDVFLALQAALAEAGHQVWSGDFSSVAGARNPEETGVVPGTGGGYGAGLAWAGSGSGALTADIFGLGKMYYWGLTYEAHLTYWLYKAYFPSLVDLPAGGQFQRTPSFDVSPYGINYWPGDMTPFYPLYKSGETIDLHQAPANSREFDVCDVAARWMGHDADFNFDEFVKEQIWGKDGAPYSAEQKAQYYGDYLLAMNNFLKYGTNPAGSDLLPPSVKYWKKFTADGRCHPTRCITPLHIGFTLTYEG